MLFCYVFFPQPLFMSAEGGGLPGVIDPAPSAEAPEPQDSEPSKVAEQGPGMVEEAEEDWSEGKGKDCVVCQNAAVNRVLLPCRHACVCDGCVSRFQHCPICRAFVSESFALSQPPSREEVEDKEEEE